MELIRFSEAFDDFTSLLVAAPEEGAGGGPWGFFCGCKGRVEVEVWAFAAELDVFAIAAAGTGVAGELFAVCIGGLGMASSVDSGARLCA